MLTTTEIAGFIGAGLAGAAYIPQISHLIRARCSAGISRLAFEIWLLASVLTTARAIALSHPEARQPHRRAARGVTNLAEPAARDHRPPSAHSPRPGGLSKHQAGCLLTALADGRMQPSPRPLMGLMTGWDPTRPRS